MASDDVPDGWVRLNVGGRIFVTMKQTLRISPFFARLFETDDRMPDAAAHSTTHFVDRNPDRFTKVLDYLRDGKLLVDKNFNLEELRMEADFYGLDDLVNIINETKAQDELRNTTKYVVVTSKDNNSYGGRWIEIAVNPLEGKHFLLQYLQQHYGCRVRSPSFQFPYGYTFGLKACGACGVCVSESYDFHCQRRPGYNTHGCACTPNTADAMLKDVVATLESHGYVMDRSVDATFTAEGRRWQVLPTSWTFIKRER